MNTNPNKIITVIALTAVLCSAMCACGTTEQKEPDSTTEPTTVYTETTQQSVTEETATLPEEITTAEPATQEPSSNPVSPSKPSAPQKPTAPATTVTEAETTLKAPKETTTRHSNAIANAFITADQILSYRLISKDEINNVASEIADSTEIYYVRLQDGTKTYYMAVDLQTAQAIALSNPAVLRELCRQLDAKQTEMADGSEGDYVLMDYTHLVGELEVHFLGYLLTGALGADDGVLASFYRSCKVADLNIDEGRLGPIIDIIGVIYG